MIKIRILKEKGAWKQIKVSGHAMYDEYGKDIVCAGVSSILTTTVNAILMFQKDSISFKEENDFILNILKEDEITSKLILNMVNLLKELQESYPKNISIREDE